MGRLGFPVPQGVWVPRQKVRTQFVIAGETDEDQEKPVDKVLAYTAFYVLLFAAYCAFLPVQTGSAFAYVRDLSPISSMTATDRYSHLRRTDKETVKNMEWSLRGLSD
ncbi:MAG: hypothetical protein AAF362_07880 [Pseudomonadota bacterium]